MYKKLKTHCEMNEGRWKNRLLVGHKTSKFDDGSIFCQMHFASLKSGSLARSFSSICFPNRKSRNHIVAHFGFCTKHAKTCLSLVDLCVNSLCDLRLANHNLRPRKLGKAIVSIVEKVTTAKFREKALSLGTACFLVKTSHFRNSPKDCLSLSRLLALKWSQHHN